MKSLFRSFLAAIGFLTRIPVPFSAVSSDQATQDLRNGVIFFPLVGWLIGLSTAGIILLANQVWPISVAVLLGLIWEACLTGAFHEDAVADFCDAFGGGWNRDDILRILKDSRIGSFGTVGLCLALLLRYATTTSVPLQQLWIIVPTAATVGRSTILLIMALVPSIPERASLARDVGQRITWMEVLLGFLLILPMLILAIWQFLIPMVGSLLIILLFGLWLRRYLHRTIGGVTGDCLGFACYFGQLIVLLCFTGNR